ncbi:MAG: dipeptidase [Kiritimatiellia bacterium]
MEMTSLERNIAAARAAALGCLGMTPEEAAPGLAWHEELMVCDNFGFLPAIWSLQAADTLRTMIANGASYAEIRPVREAICRETSVFNQDCRQEFLGAVRATGLNCMALTVGSEKSLHHSLHRISWYIQMFDYLAPWLRKAVCYDDIAVALTENKLAVVCSANCPPAQSGLEDGMDVKNWVEIFYRFGIRIMHLTYNRRNWVGDGCLEPANGGLSLHGRDVIRQMNRLGIVVDTPHSGERTTIEAAEYSQTPIMASHTTCRALHNHPRGKSDDALKAIAASGGLVGICVLPHFLGGSADINALLDHVDHAVNLIGADHVAIGTDAAYQSDFPGGLAEFETQFPKAGAYSADRWFGAWGEAKYPDVHITPEGKASLSWLNWPYFTVGMRQRGYSRETIAKILGGNFLRVFRAVEDAAVVSV